MDCVLVQLRVYYLKIPIGPPQEKWPISAAEAAMTVAPDFFDTGSRNWRARLAVSVEVMRELSRYSDPQEMHAVFSRRMSQLFPVSRQISISRRGLRFPQYRVTRCNLW